MKYLMPIQFSLKIFRFGWWTSPTGAHDCITRFFCTAKSFYSLINVFCFRASNVYEDKGKVLTEQRANGRNIVGCYMLRPFAHPVACCWELLDNKLETSQTFSYVQRDATTPNIVGSSLTWKNWVGLSFSISNPFASWPSKEVYYYSSFKKLFGFQMRFLGF